MAVRRALVFRVGGVGLLCAAYEVAIERGSQDQAGTMRPVRDCPNPATETWQAADGSLMGLCADCCAAVRASSSVGVVVSKQRPGTN
jgi:hypothetical protein